jgi:nucleotide-binding universal stress UspA family protein
VSDYLNRAGEPLRKKGLKVSTVVAMGNAADEIIKAAEENKVDLVAMSTHGRSGLRRLAFGSITDKVLRHSPVPVLTVRATEGTVNE